jgi:NSS family neurotransmitter:Na+ symporter
MPHKAKAPSGGKARETLGSRLGFILLSAGCAIGLGNVWRFPYITGAYGGAAFVLIYLFFLITLAMPIMVMEFSVGRASKRSVISSFKELKPGGCWSAFGYTAFCGNVILMMFYTVVTGWMLAYFWYSLSGQLQGLSAGEVGEFFGDLLASPKELIAWMTLSILLGTLICSIGLRSGVERVTKVMMIGLFLLMAVLALRSVSLPGAGAGLEFYLKPDFAKLTQGEGGKGLWSSVYAAMGQAFFTLSLGIGSMAIFGSYILRDRSLTGESALVVTLDTVVALCAGLIIFPACYAYGVDAGSGPSLIFVSLPVMFNYMGQTGRFWGALFFLFMSCAAMSTVVAVFENIIACFMDRLGWRRSKASAVNMLAIFVLSIPCALGFNVWSGFAPLGEGSIILDLEDFILSNNLLPMGAIVYLLFCTSKRGWGWDNFLKEADTGRGMKFPGGLRFYCSYIVPAIMLFVLLMGYYEKFFM